MNSLQISFCVGHEYFSQRSQCHVDYYKRIARNGLKDYMGKSVRHELFYTFANYTQIRIRREKTKILQCFNPSILVFVLKDFLMVAVKYMQSQSGSHQWFLRILNFISTLEMESLNR
ncbi:hypothetical protein T09_8518 [Trichinella sp. T9]|nr:hypothetical protein T09_9739 [Trichinella sp. T9]KRX51350.1 hypothetical protein T09_8518 [Trichinella sp. T9]